MLAANRCLVNISTTPAIARVAAAKAVVARVVAVKAAAAKVVAVKVKATVRNRVTAARASRVVRHFVERGLAESRLRAIGYAATRPIDRTDSNEARARNRRVTLLLDVRPPARP